MLKWLMPLLAIVACSKEEGPKEPAARNHSATIPTSSLPPKVDAVPQDTCYQYMKHNGVFLSPGGPVGPTAWGRHFDTVEDAIRTVVAELARECPASSQAHVHRANMLLLLSQRESAAAALRRALELDSGWTEQDKAVARRALQELSSPQETAVYASIQQQEQAARLYGLDGTMSIPGLTGGFGAGVPGLGIGSPVADINITATGQQPSQAQPWAPWAIFGGVLAVGTGLGFGICYAAGCFDPGPTTWQAQVQPPAIPTGPNPWTAAPRPLGPVLGVVEPRKRDADYVLRVRLFAALDLPPPDSSTPVEAIPTPVAKSCDDYFSLLSSRTAKEHPGLTTVTHQAVARGRLQAIADQVCIDWTGWELFTFSVSSVCVPLIVPNMASTGCRGMVSQFNEACLRHEAQHYRDITQTLTGGPQLQTRTCMPAASFSPESQTQLEAAWNAQWRKDLAETIGAAKNALHRTKEGIPLGFGSAFCDACFSDVVRLDGSGPRFAAANDVVVVDATAPTPGRSLPEGNGAAWPPPGLGIMRSHR